ncbi:MAG: FGGY family carbohydrate kinase [Defluviitaleaceae bacterium]|nr:FGGY family carbohydrate kinase [Defluviitaleaceae bacterium]
MNSRHKLNILAVDYGASGGKAIIAAFDGGRLECREIHRFANEPCRIIDNLYWNVFEMYGNLKTALCKAAKCGPVASVGIDSWATDYGVLDAQGNLLENPHSYMDDRTLDVIETVNSIYTPFELFCKTGVEPHHRFALHQMLALRKNGRAVYENAASAMFMPNLLGYFCTGLTSCEATQASTTLMYDPFLRGWNDGVFEKFGLRNLFPKLNGNSSVLGGLLPSVANETGTAGVKVINIPQHDSAAAMAASSAARDGTFFVSSGTWSVMGTYLDEPVVTREAFDKKFNNQIGFGDKVMFVKNVLGLRITAKCAEEWAAAGTRVDYGALDAEAEKSGFDSYIDLSENWLNKEGSTEENIKINCAKRGMAVPVRPAETYASVINALANEYGRTAADLEKITGKKFARAHIVGGGAKSGCLCRRTAQKTGLEVIAGPYEATAAGNVIAQLIALGEINSESEAETLIENSFELKRF